jgi:hypothetical protein
MNIALWVVAALLAVLMLNASTKLFVPKEQLATKYGRGWMGDNSVGFVKSLEPLSSWLRGAPFQRRFMLPCAPS